MEHYTYLIVGGGMAAAAAVMGIRSNDPEGSLAVLGEEAYKPYKRPPLSKGLWQGKPLDRIWLGTEKQKVDLITGRRVMIVDPENNTVQDDIGNSYEYEKLLLATGGTPRRLPFGDDLILYYRTLADYYRLQTQISEGAHQFGVIGGGFIGSEIAAALRMNDQNVTMLFPERGIGALVFPKDLSDFVNGYYREKGVEVLAGHLVSDVTPEGGKIAIDTGDGDKLVVDQVVAGIGIVPNTDLAQKAGIKVDNGILVDEHLRTNLPNIYAAGDNTSFYSPALERRMRVEHEDNALTMGMIAGENMSGADKAYHHLPYFYSDMFDLGYEAVGELNSKLDVYEDWEEPNRKGVLYYLDDGRIKGVLLWNVWGKVDAARNLIEEKTIIQPDKLQKENEHPVPMND